MTLSTPRNLNWHRTSGTIGHIFFFVLFAFSLMYYKERMLAFDPSFFSFLMIQDMSFSIALGRWGAVFSEVLPLIGLKSGINLEGFLQLFSASFILLYYIYFLIIHYVYRNTRATVVLLLTLCLTFRSTFYYSTAELYQALGLCVLFWAVLEKAVQKPKFINPQFFVAVGLIILISFFHQLAALPVLFIIGFEYLSRKNWKSACLLSLGALTFLWFIVRIKFMSTSAYEQNKMLSSADFFNNLSNLASLSSTKYVAKFILSSLLVPAITGVLVVLGLLWKKKWLPALFTVFAAGGFSVIVIVTLGKGDSEIMTENYFTVLGLFIALPLIREFYDEAKLPVVGLSVLLTLYSLCAIQNSHHYFTTRLTYLNNLVSYARQFENKKLVISKSNLDPIVSVPWALPFESTLLSSIPGKHNTAAIFAEDEKKPFSDADLARPNVFFGPTWEPFWFTSNNLNQAYLALPSGPYLRMNSWQSDTTFKESNFTKENIVLKGCSLRYDHDFFMAEVEIKNNSPFKLHSIPAGPNPVVISYHLYDKDWKMIKWDNVRTMLTVDILQGHSFVQSVHIERPEPGQYYVDFDLVVEGKRWLGIDHRVVMIVK